VILVDDRTGSGLGDKNNIIPHLERIGAQVKKTRMKFGDISFEGRGPEDRVVSVGFELKEFRNDFLGSVKDGRLVGTQLPGLQRAYEVRFLLLHGQIRRGRNGLLETNHPKWGWISPIKAVMYDDIERLLWSLKFGYGIEWAIVPDMADAARFVFNLYRWWTDKAWEEHETGHAFDFSTDKMYLHQPSFARTIAKDLPGVGWKRSKDVVHAFRTMYQMALADEGDWRKVPGIGKVNARRIYKAIHEG
jgi:ERCC4-type nuclease